MRHKLLIAMLFSLAALCATACAPKLGDSCENSIECSATGDRLCDRSQPGGYCTIASCEPGSCGDEGVCVRFKPGSARLASSWCMAKCDSTRDCDRDQYVCRSAGQLNASAQTRDSRAPVGSEDAVQGSSIIAEVLDDAKGAKFCVVRE